MVKPYLIKVGNISHTNNHFVIIQDVRTPRMNFICTHFLSNPRLNMSRIIHKKIDVELEDVSSVSKTNLSIYAQNYNVLHVESGLAGLKF